MSGVIDGRAAHVQSQRVVAEIDRRAVHAARLLSEAGVPYAVVGGKAVQWWVASVDVGAGRNTKDVNILVRRDRLPVVIAALETGGFE